MSPEGAPPCEHSRSPWKIQQAKATFHISTFLSILSNKQQQLHLQQPICVCWTHSNKVNLFHNDTPVVARPVHFHWVALRDERREKPYTIYINSILLSITKKLFRRVILNEKKNKLKLVRLSGAVYSEMCALYLQTLILRIKHCSKWSTTRDCIETRVLVVARMQIVGLFHFAQHRFRIFTCCCYLVIASEWRNTRTTRFHAGKPFLLLLLLQKLHPITSGKRENSQLAQTSQLLLLSLYY